MREVISAKDPVLKMMGDYRHRAKQRGYKFDLNYFEFRALITSPCFYCSCDPEPRAAKFSRNGTSYLLEYHANGIDRVDSHFGYRLENCVTCCMTCNTMKGALTHDEFLVHIQKILTNLVK